jgi:chromosome segregation ATPase
LSALRDQHTQDRNRWEAEIQVRDLQIDDLTKRTDSLQAAITDKDGKLTNADRTITVLQEELQAAHRDLETTQADMGKLADRVFVLEGQVNALSAERATILSPNAIRHSRTAMRSSWSAIARSRRFSA